MAVLRRSKGPREYRLRDDRRFKAVNHAVLRKGVCVPREGALARNERRNQPAEQRARPQGEWRIIAHSAAVFVRSRPFCERVATRATNRDNEPPNERSVRDN